jgi:hypothetical protein
MFKKTKKAAVTPAESADSPVLPPIPPTPKMGVIPGKNGTHRYQCLGCGAWVQVLDEFCSRCTAKKDA